MTGASLSPPIRRLLALSILVLVAWSLCSLVLWPAIQLPLTRQAEIDNLANELGLLRAIANRAPLLKARAHALSVRLAAEQGFWSGKSDETIAVRIQRLIRKAVTSAGGQVTSVSDATRASGHGFPRMTIKVQSTGTIETLQRALITIARAQPALFVDDLDVSAIGGGTAINKPPRLTIAFDVTAYQRPPIR